MSESRAYKRPPIVERVITAYVKMAVEEFAEKEESWKGKASRGFPYFTPRVEWDVNWEEKDGMPVLADGGPTVKIHHWFFEHPHKETRGFAHHSDAWDSNMCKMSINLLRDGDKVFRFRDLENKFKEWLPQWAEHFGVKTFTGAALDYVNLLNKQTVGDFYEEGRLHVGKVFKLFSNIPGPHLSIVPPYDCRLNLLLDEKMPANARIRIRDGQADGLKIEMQMSSLSPEQKQITVEQLFAEVLAHHNWMIMYFEALFTDAAKETFIPIK